MPLFKSIPSISMDKAACLRFNFPSFTEMPFGQLKRPSSKRFASISRAIGPGLAGAGISGFLVNPIMELRKVPENTLLSENDSWKSDQQSLIESTTIQPGDDVEAALVATVEQNSFYSIVVRGVNDGEGFANVEVYNFPE